VRKRLTRAEKRAQTREALLAAGERVFAREGFQGASVEKITADAGFSRGAFYSNFSSKEELFAEVLQERVYSLYRRMVAERLDDPERMPSERKTGEQLAEMQAGGVGRSTFSLWLELLAAASRDEELKRLAAQFWSGNRALTAKLIEAAERPEAPLPVPAEHIATASIAFDIGLAIQHFVDPEAVPLELYPELFELFFRPLREPGWRPDASDTPTATAARPAARPESRA
jgi:AcrR family transcriptional regulator